MSMIKRQYSSGAPRGISILGVLAVLILVGVVAFFGMTYKRWEGQPPTVTLDHDVKSLGKNPSLALNVEDAGYQDSFL